MLWNTCYRKNILVLISNLIKFSCAYTSDQYAVTVLRKKLNRHNCITHWYVLFYNYDIFGDKVRGELAVLLREIISSSKSYENNISWESKLEFSNATWNRNKELRAPILILPTVECSCMRLQWRVGIGCKELRKAALASGAEELEMRNTALLVLFYSSKSEREPQSSQRAK